MKSRRSHPTARQYAESLASAGRYSFSSSEAETALGVSTNAAVLALNRLAKQGLLASPARSIYVIIPPEYRSLGCLPPEQFIPDLMKRLKLPYYVSLLSAAEYHGAAHQRPQALQVFLEAKRRPIVCGRARVVFMVRKRLRAVPVQTLNTPRGELLISTPESTALDLVGYEQRAGGLNLVATVLSELAEKIDPAKLVAAAHAAPIVWAQRLGYLLEHVDAAAKAAPLQRYVRARAEKATPLAPARALKQGPRDPTWKVYVNAEVETDV
jgi:predicted transcriptional regulator of viral defense system